MQSNRLKLPHSFKGRILEKRRFRCSTAQMLKYKNELIGKFDAKMNKFERFSHISF